MTTPVKTAFPKIQPSNPIKTITALVLPDKPPADPQIEAIRQRLKEQRQPWLKDAGNPPKETPVTPTVTPAVAESPPAKPKVKLKPCSVSVYLTVVEAPERQGLGAVFLADTRQTGGRSIVVKLFKERLLISRALQNQDELVIRFAASLLLTEFLLYSPAGNLHEIRLIGNALRKALGGPWAFTDNCTFLVCTLAAHEMSAVDKLGLFVPTMAPKVPWLTLEATLPEPSGVWQWNPLLDSKKKQKQKAATPEGKQS